MNIKYDVSLTYEAEPQDPSDAPDLVVSHTFLNTDSKETYHLSFWNQRARFKSIEPQKNLEKIELRRPEPKPRAPVLSDIVSLRPNEVYTFTENYSGGDELPFRDDSNAYYYKVRKAGIIQFVLCYHFRDDSEVFSTYKQKPLPKFHTGSICSSSKTFTARGQGS